MKGIAKLLLLSVLLFCLTRGDEIVTILKVMDTVTATVGQDVILTCVLPEKEDDVVVWRRFGSREVLAIRQYMITRDRRISARYIDNQRKIILEIKDVCLSDETTYECSVAPTNIEYITAFKLKVQGPPAKIVEGFMLFLEASNPLKVTCVVPIVGQPGPIVWTKDEVNISNVTRNDGSIIVSEKNGTLVSTLIIDSMKTGDFGSYTCSPHNAESATIYVIEKYPVTESSNVTQKVEVSRNVKINAF